MRRWTDDEVLRELAYIELETEPPPDDLTPEGQKMMDDDEFDRQAQMAGEGRWAELGLDELPADWKPTTIEDLRNA